MLVAWHMSKIGILSNTGCFLSRLDRVGGEG